MIIERIETCDQSHGTTFLPGLWGPAGAGALWPYQRSLLFTFLVSGGGLSESSTALVVNENSNFSLSAAP